MDVPQVAEHIKNWLFVYNKNAKTKGFVVGVSGGVDSALTSTLCAETKLPVLCVEMPIHQDINQVNRAINHIEKLKEKYPNVSSQSVNLTSVFGVFKEKIPLCDNQEATFLALANTRARLRMTTLYYFASIHNFLVTGTGNKVEDFGVGFFTKYGDGGVDISPIADLLKSEVYALAKYLNVSQDILSSPPTDGLWGDSRTDEDQIGATYNELEWAMNMKVSGKTKKDFSGRQKDVFDIYDRLNKTNEHKMIPIPVCKIPK